MCTQHQLEKSRSSPSERARSCETGCHQYRPAPSQLQLHRHSKLSDQLCSILSHTHTAAPRTTSSVRMPRGGPTPAGAGSAGLPPRGRQPGAQRPGGKTDRRPPQPAAAGGGRRAAGTGSRPGYKCTMAHNHTYFFTFTGFHQQFIDFSTHHEYTITKNHTH